MRIRGFIAVPLSARLQRDIGTLQRKLKRLLGNAKFVQPHQIHITLHFFGNIEVELAREVFLDACSNIPLQEPLRLRIQGLGAFGSLEAARVLWVGVRGEVEGLSKLFVTIRNAVQHRGLEVERRPFHPHLTLARFKGRPRRLRVRELPMDYDLGVEEVSTMRLYKSTLTPSGPIYEVVEEYSWTG